MSVYVEMMAYAKRTGREEQEDQIAGFNLSMAYLERSSLC